MKKVKSPSKIYNSDLKFLQNKIIKVMNRIAEIVGSSLGPNGRNVLIESELTDIPNKNTKDGVTIFRALGADDPIEHLIIEQTRDVAIRTVNEAGDGPQPLYSKILTPKGFIKMSDIKSGMEICGTDGTIQTVLEVFPKGSKEIYEVEIANRGIVECCKDHLWEVHYGTKSKTIKTTEQLAKDATKTSKYGHKISKYYTPNTFVEFESNPGQILIDPYLLGTLIGDGCLRDGNSIELSLGKNKEHIIGKLNLPEGITANVKWVDSKNYFRVKITGNDKNGKSIRDLVKEIGLFNTDSHTKFIPKSYLYSPKEVREALLQGLLDTDGHINDRNLFEFSTVSDQLSKDFIELVNGLGKNVNYRLQKRSKEEGAYSNTSVHRICELVGYKHGNKIVRVTPTGRFTEMQCIKVSNSNNLYITDNYVVTHNTTTSVILASALIKNLFNFCQKNKRYSPQKVTRQINKLLQEVIVPAIAKNSIKVTSKNQELLEKVATISANGDKEMSKAVIEAFETIGYGDSSHVTIEELSGPSNKYEVELIEGFPFNKGYEESIGKFHNVFINDQANRRVLLENPLFILFDGVITDMKTIFPTIERLGEAYVSGESEFNNIVVVAHGFSDPVLTTLSYNFPNPSTINIVPLATPIEGIANSQLNFLMDLSAFTGAKIFGMNEPLSTAKGNDFGYDMERIEIYRFRTTVVGQPDELNIQKRASDLKKQSEQSESKMEKRILTERIGKLTNGIAKLKIYGASNGELKEKSDRAEDAVCAVRATITNGALPGGCRMLINLTTLLNADPDPVIQDVVIPSLSEPFIVLLDNAGYSEDEIEEILTKLIEDPELVYDVENSKFGTAKELGVYDATMAVEQALKNAVSIASVMGTLGGIVCSPRDHQLERKSFLDQQDFDNTLENAQHIKNEANERP